MFLMVVLVELMLYCCWISGYENWGSDWSCPTACALGFKKGGEPLQYPIVNFVLILYAYPIAILLLWRNARIAWIVNYRPWLFD